MQAQKILIHLQIGLEYALFFKLEHFEYVALIKKSLPFCFNYTKLMSVYIYIYIYKGKILKESLVKGRQNHSKK